MHAHKKRGYWLFVRRVPRECAAFDKRKSIFQTTGVPIATDPLGLLAQTRVTALNALAEQLWRDLATGLDTARERYAKAVAEVVAVRNERTKPLKGPIAGNGDVAVSGLVDEMEKICAAAHMKKSPAQHRRWRWPRERAIETFIEVIGGDPPIAKLTRRQVGALADFWQQRVLDGEIMIGTANKSIRLVASMFRMVNRKGQLDLADIFQHAAIEGEKDARRVMYEKEFIQEKLLADGAFDGINPQARGVLYLMVETGIRPSEACGLAEENIRLDCSVPHVVVADTQRELKSDNAQRVIPLVGVSLMAMRANPKGFPRYWDKADSLSAVLNKALNARGLRPIRGQSLYSLRHSFESRLTVAGVDDRVRAELMGHTYYREKYGDGGTLEFKRDCIRRAALRPPTRV